jgi:hypothetical protein
MEIDGVLWILIGNECQRSLEYDGLDMILEDRNKDVAGSEIIGTIGCLIRGKLRRKSSEIGGDMQRLIG